MKNLLFPLSIGAASALSTGMALAASAGSQVSINEIRIDQVSSDTDEFFEIVGAPGLSLNNLTYIVIGDSPAGGSGVIEAVVHLGGQTIGASGYFVAGESTLTTGVPDLVTTLNFENGDNVTHMLVAGFTGADGDDLDTDDDGTFDVTPWSTAEDTVSLVQSLTSGSLFYSNTIVGPDGLHVPGHVSIIADNWEIGAFEISYEDTPGRLNAIATGTTFCDPAEPNFTGEPVVLSGYFGSGVGSNLHLEATGGTTGYLCYFLVSGAANDPGILIDSGFFCLGGQFYRYSLFAGGEFASEGLFGLDGVHENALGTSTVGTGYDVASSLPASVPFPIFAGNTWHFQAWYRDIMPGDGTPTTSNFSNGLSVTF
ncbi:MAG: hypothetical protein GY930_14010 [bacterium]|nr:hypothetical protein [bacterium]